MRQRDDRAPESAEKTVRDIRRATRRRFSAEEKIRESIAALRIHRACAWNQRRPRFSGYCHRRVIVTRLYRLVPSKPKIAP